MHKYKPLSKCHSIVFSIAELHKLYWKEFCDVCYVRFGFEVGEVRTYEQKFETFCRCKLLVTDDNDYEDELLFVNEEDLEQLNKLSSWFYDQKDDSVLIPSLFLMFRKMRAIEANLRKDIRLIPYICPRNPGLDYSKFLLDKTKLVKQQIPHCRNIRDVLKDTICSSMLEEMLGDSFYNYTADTLRHEVLDNGVEFDYNAADGDITELVDMILENEITIFDNTLHELISLLSNLDEYSRESECKAVLFRLFMSYEDSLKEIKEMLDELPFPQNIYELQEERDRLISEFEQTDIGKRWIKCMEHEGGIKAFSKYFIHHRNKFTIKEEHVFFYNLDKICIIDDVLKGNTEKYWIEVKYPSKWLYGSLHSSETPQPSCPFVLDVSCSDMVLAKIQKYQSGKKKPKDVAMPVRAAMDAGVIRRPTYDEYCGIEGMAKIGKSSLSEYTNPDNEPYTDEAYRATLKDFETFKSEK